MALVYPIHVLYQTRVQQEDTLIIGDGELLRLLSAIVGPLRSVAVARGDAAAHTPRASLALSGHQLEDMPLSHPGASADTTGAAEPAAQPDVRHVANPVGGPWGAQTLAGPGGRGYQLIVRYHPTLALPLAAVRSEVPIWCEYLARGGRIVLQMHRERDGAGKFEAWKDTVTKYRDAAQEVGMRLTHVNGFPIGKDLDARAITESQITQSLYLVRRTAEHLRRSYPFEAALLQTTAEQIQKRLLVKTLSWVRPITHHFTSQSRLWCTLQRGAVGEKG